MKRTGFVAGPKYFEIILVKFSFACPSSLSCCHVKHASHAKLLTPPLCLDLDLDPLPHLEVVKLTFPASKLREKNVKKYFCFSLKKATGEKNRVKFQKI